jgi:hypothetical protein
MIDKQDLDELFEVCEMIIAQITESHQVLFQTHYHLQESDPESYKYEARTNKGIISVYQDNDNGAYYVEISISDDAFKENKTSTGGKAFFARKLFGALKERHEKANREKIYHTISINSKDNEYKTDFGKRLFELIEKRYKKLRSEEKERELEERQTKQETAIASILKNAQKSLAEKRRLEQEIESMKQIRKEITDGENYELDEKAQLSADAIDYYTKEKIKELKLLKGY